MRVGGGGKKSSAWTSGLKERPSGKAILQNKASQHPERPTRPDGQDVHFVIADVASLFHVKLVSALTSDHAYPPILFPDPLGPGREC